MDRTRYTRFRTLPIADLNRIAKAGPSFDYVGISVDHLARLPRVADACPSLTSVLDHLNVPPIAKVLGLEMSSASGTWTPEDWRPYTDHAFAYFDHDRFMLGSNWPVSTLSGQYAPIWAAHREWLSDLSGSEQASITSATAGRVYTRGKV